MGMVFCRGCGKEIHVTAVSCPQCGSPQGSSVKAISNTGNGPIWMSITSLVLGIISVLALLDDPYWDEETILGLGIFAVAGLVIGTISITKYKSGKGMAIAGVVLSSIALLSFIGMLAS